MEELVKLFMNFFDTDNVEVLRPTPFETTIPDMLSDNPKDRMRAEYRQLLIRYQAISSYIRKIENNKVNHDCHMGLLKEQQIVMEKYINILVKRSVIEGVDLVG